MAQCVVIYFSPVAFYKCRNQQDKRALRLMKVRHQAAYNLEIVAGGDDYLRGSNQFIGMNFLSPKYLDSLAEMRIGKKYLSDHPGTEVEIKPFYDGNVYYMFTKKVYQDIRLVGAPPSSIGKFGADTDNWMWPRHTGDFSVFRIYADANGNPAKYSPGNVPLHPKRWFKISIKGVEENDYAMIMGFPGRTNKYYTSCPPAATLIFTLSIANSGVFNQKNSNVTKYPSLCASRIKFTTDRVAKVVSIANVSPIEISSLTLLYIIRLASTATAILLALKGESPFAISSELTNSLHFSISGKMVNEAVVFPAPLHPAIMYKYGTTFFTSVLTLQIYAIDFYVVLFLC